MGKNRSRNIGNPEKVLGVSFALFGSEPVPLHRRNIVLWDTSAFRVYQTGAGVQPKLEEQPDAKTIAHAPEPEMRSAFEEVGETVPQRRDE